MLNDPRADGHAAASAARPPAASGVAEGAEAGAPGVADAPPAPGRAEAGRARVAAASAGLGVAEGAEAGGPGVADAPPAPGGAEAGAERAARPAGRALGLVGRVLRIERASIHDGAGLRTVVFLQGCPLRCAWCSTPESQFARPGVGRDPAALYGESMTVAEVVAEITRDEVFYYHSGGGATISGGEPLAQGEFTAAILKAVKAHGIATAVETTLFAAPKYVFAALEWTDHLLVDIKHTDSAAHARWTGVPVEPIIRNLRAVGASGFPGRITVRLPYIPGINSERANLVATGRIAAGLPGPAELELVPYHRLGVGTYEALDWDYALPDLRPPARADLMAAVAYLADSIPGLTVALAR